MFTWKTFELIQLEHLSVDTPRNGFAKAVQTCLRLKVGALLSIGLPCSSFVWINKYTSERSQGSPWGNETKPYIIAHNASLGLKIHKSYSEEKMQAMVSVYKSYQCVRMQSWELRIAVRTLFLLLLCTFRGVYTCVEQPMTSSFKTIPTYATVKAIISKFITPFYQQFLF